MSNGHQELSPSTSLALRDCAACCAVDPAYAPVLLEHLALALAARARDADDPLALIAGGLMHLAEAARADLALGEPPLPGETVPARAAAGER